MFTNYAVEMTLLRDMLATNPLDPHVMDTHILEKSRRLILEKSKDQKEINKYLDALQVSKERGQEEVDRIVDRLESLIGRQFSADERAGAIAGELENLRETVAELDMRGTTVFFWDKATNRPAIGDHMIYGFLKAASEAISRTLERKNGKVLHSASYTQSIINQHVRCLEQFIPFDKDIKRKEDGTPSYNQRSLRAMTAQGPRTTLVRSEAVEAGAKLRFNLRVMTGSPLEHDHLKKMFQMGEMFGLGQWRNAGYGTFTFELQEVKPNS
jgi:hypothetical protein